MNGKKRHVDYATPEYLKKKDIGYRIVRDDQSLWIERYAGVDAIDTERWMPMDYLPRGREYKPNDEVGLIHMKIIDDLLDQLVEKRRMVDDGVSFTAAQIVQFARCLTLEQMQFAHPLLNAFMNVMSPQQRAEVAKLVEVMKRGDEVT